MFDLQDLATDVSLCKVKKNKSTNKKAQTGKALVKKDAK